MGYATSIDLDRALMLSKALAVKAGLAILEVYHSDFEVLEKGDHTPLTFADTIANKIILSSLMTEFPQPSFGYLSEESKDNKARIKAKYCFIIDPLDGTKEFVKKNDEFTVNIGLVENGKPIMGVIYAPVKDELYYACINNGAFVQHEGEKAKPIQTTDKTSNLILVGSKSHSGEQLASMIKENKEKIQNVVSYGSSLKGCMVAAGKADIYYRFGYTCEWDTCAMHCIAECAGATVKQMDHTPLTYNRQNTLNEKGFYIINHKDNVLI